MTAQLYRCFDAEGNLLYVGATKNVFQRIVEHKSQSYWSRYVTRVEIQHFDSRKEALAAEAVAITLENPKHNTVTPRVPGVDFNRSNLWSHEIRAKQANWLRSLQQPQQS